MNLKKLSMHPDLDCFAPASDAEKEYMVQMRPSTTFFKDGLKRLMKNKRAKTSSEIRAAYKDDPAAAEAEISRLAAKGLLIEEWSAKDIEADPERIGFAGSPTKVKQVQSVILTAGDAKSVEPTADGIAQLMHELISDHTLG